MQKLITFFLYGLIFFLASCNSNERTGLVEKQSEDATSIFPVTDFLKGQLNEIESMPVTPLKTVTINGNTDSAWVTRESVRPFVAPFLTPVIDSASMSSYFSAKSFLDQTINAFTLTYDANKNLPGNIKLRHWDVYIDPQRNNVQRIYLVKEKGENGVNVITQLTWKTNKWCSIRTILQKPGSDPEVKEEKIIWDFN